MLILGIETSCDETAASLVEVKNNKIRVISNIVSSQVKLHAKYGGVVPSLAAREHVKNLRHVLKLAVGKTKFRDIDLIAVTSGPGLVSSLLVGTAFAKTLAWKLKKPIIGVNHIEGHIYSNWLGSSGKAEKIKTNEKKIFPALCLVVSGGHSELILMTNYGKHKLIGQTLDDAAGEAFDKIARILKLGYPGGPAISAAAERFVSKNALGIKLPRPIMTLKNFNFSFSGLKTAVLYTVRDLTKTHPLSKITTEIAHEAQQAIADVLVTKTMRAAEKFKVKSIMLSGGVSANKLLRQELEYQATEFGVKFFKPELEYTTDNAAMIALAGYFGHKLGRPIQQVQGKQKTDWQSLHVDANWEIT